MPNQSFKQSDQFSIYDYDKRSQRTWKMIRKEISAVNIQFIEDYEMAMVTDNLAKAGRQKHLETLLSLSRIVKIPFNEKYYSDNRVFCRQCERFMKISGVRCPCCKGSVRNRPRSKKKGYDPKTANKFSEVSPKITD